MGMISIGHVAFFLLALAISVNADGWGQVASQQSDAAPIPAPAQPIAGGWSQVDLKDKKQLAKLTKLAEAGLKQINRKSNSLYRQNLVQVVKAYKQIVSGVLYHITFTTGQGTCRNTEENLSATFETCPLSGDPGALYQQCTVRIWSQPWRGFQEVSQEKCARADASVVTDALKS